MADSFSPAERRRIMQAVKGRDTKPEQLVATLLRELKVRCSRHRATIPGKPDFVFTSRRKLIFVHGCFWHRHICRKGQSMPATRRDFWEAKFAGNRERDRRLRSSLRRLGWTVLIVWECQLTKKKLPAVKKRLARFLLS